MKRLMLGSIGAVLAISVASEAFAWGAVHGAYGGAAYRGPMGTDGRAGSRRRRCGARSVRRCCREGRRGRAQAAYRPPAGGAYYGGVARPYYPGAAVATGAVIGAAAATAYRPPAYYAPPVVVAPPPCGYYPYPPCY